MDDLSKPYRERIVGVAANDRREHPEDAEKIVDIFLEKLETFQATSHLVTNRASQRAALLAVRDDDEVFLRRLRQIADLD
jgi:hypothetical protein